MDNAIRLLFERVWALFNLGIYYNGFLIKFWYFPAFLALLSMTMKIFGFFRGGITLEKSGSTSTYKNKAGGKNDYD